jgi:hypothetical protein
MALWGISTTTETAANRYGIPKFLNEVDRNRTPHNCFADERGWIYRIYGSNEQSGLSTSYYDEVLVPVAGLNTVGFGSNTTGLGLATPVAVFFEDSNRSSPISIGAGGTSGIGTGRNGFVHLVFNEIVNVSSGATVLINQFTATGTPTGTPIVATARSFANGATVTNFVNGQSFRTFTSFNGQITNRVAFAFTAPATGIGSVLRIDTGRGFIGVITDFSGGVGVTSTFTADMIRNIGGAGAFGSGVGIGTTTLTISA